MVALPPKSNGDGPDLPGDPDTPGVAEVEQFEAEFRENLPRMDQDALRRVEQKLHAELERAEQRWLWNWRNRSAGGGRAGGQWLNVLAAAAVVLLVAGVSIVVFLALNRKPPINNNKNVTPFAQIVVDEMDVIIEQQVDPSAPPLFERPMIDLSPYQSLIGEENVTQR